MNEKQLARYLRAVRRRLSLSGQMKDRVMDDLRSSINERREAGQTDAEIFAALGPAKQAAAELTAQLPGYAFRKSPLRFICLGAAVLALLVGLLKTVTNLRGFASIGVIGGADGPTAIFLTNKLAPHLLGAIAIAAYSYMALIPMIQPPIMKLMTSDADRKIKMVQARVVSKTEKILFPIIVTIFVILLLPSTAPLIGCLMLGNLFRECGCTDRLSDTVQNALMNIVTIFLSTSVGATMVASNFLKPETLKIIFLGLVAFGISTAGGLIGGNIMCKLSGKKVNPLIGSAGVSAVPMAARVSQMVGQKANPANFLLMHAMGPNVAGVIGSAIAAGFLLAVFG